MANGKDKGIDLDDAGRSAPTGANYLLAIAINAYEHHPKLSNCVRDAERLVATLQEKYGFKAEHTYTLFDEQATAQNIYTHLATLSREVSPKDNVVIYFSGHGFYDQSDKTGHLVPVEATTGAVWHYFSNANLVNRIRAINSFHTFLIIDSCFSGSLFASKDATALAEVVKGLPSRWALAAGQIETVEDGLHEDHSPFAKALLSYLEANNSPLVPASELIQHVKRVTPHNARQTPVGGVLFKTGDVGGEFVFRLRQTEGQLWERAKAAGTLAAYRQFLDAYPEGEHTVEAKRLIEEAEEAEAWQRALERNTIAGYDAYLAKYSQGKHSTEALEALDQLEEAKAWRKASQRDSVGAYRKYLADHPEGEHKEGAESRIRELLGREREAEAWQTAQQADSIAAFKTYLAQFPQGAHAEAAQRRIRSLEQQAQQEKEEVGSGSVYQRPYPPAPPGGRGATAKVSDERPGSNIPAWLKYALPIGLVILSIIFWQLSSGNEPAVPAEQLSVGTEEGVDGGEVAIPGDMVFIQGGSFEMGDTFGDGQDDEKPVHTVTVSDFYMGIHEVTFDEFDSFCDATRREKPDDRGWGRGRRPVIYVSWNDAVAYCNWLSEQHSFQKVYTISGSTVTANWNANGYRLLTEAEWEFAARQRGQKVRFGNGEDTADPKYINFNGSANYKEPYSIAGVYREKTVPVGSLSRPNSLGLDDMSGNVWEWCWDWYDNSYYEKSKNSRDPRGPDSGSYRVLRGGSWNGLPAYVRCAFRNFNTPDVRYSFIGFRLARAVR